MSACGYLDWNGVGLGEGGASEGAAAPPSGILDGKDIARAAHGGVSVDAAARTGAGADSRADLDADADPITLAPITAAAVTASATAAAVGDLSFIAGVCPHMAWGFSTDFVVDKLADLGTRSFRDEAYWAAYERQKGVYDVRGLSSSMQDALAGRIDVSTSILLLDYGNPFYRNGARPVTDDVVKGFVDYAVNLVKDGGWRFGFIEIWNEWNVPMQENGESTGGSAADYARLFKAVAQAIRPLGSFKILTGAGVDHHDGYRFQREMIAQGVLRYADGYGHHSYNWSDREIATPQRQMQRLAEVQAFLTAANGGKPVPMYLTEAGWPIWRGSRYSEVQAGLWTAELLSLAQDTGWIKGVWLYNLFDKGTDYHDPEQGFGIYGPQGQEKGRTVFIREAMRAVNAR